MRRTITGSGAQLRFSISLSLSVSLSLSLSLSEVELFLINRCLSYTPKLPPGINWGFGYRLRYSPPSQHSSLSPLHLHTNIRLGSFSKEEQNRAEQNACSLAHRALLFSTRATLLLLLLLRRLAKERKKERKKKQAPSGYPDLACEEPSRRLGSENETKRNVSAQLLEQWPTDVDAACLHYVFDPGGPGGKEVQGMVLGDCAVTFMLDLCRTS